MTSERNSTRMQKQSFDPYDEDSYNFGDLSRQEANQILLDEASGVFLIRCSLTKKGDLVLCVVEDRLVSHYIINYKDEDENKWLIGTNRFPDIPSLLTYYSTKVLKSSTLLRPAKHLQFITKSSYVSMNPQELKFEKGVLLTMLHRNPDQQTYRMKNESGLVGIVHQQYVDKYDPNEHFMLRRTSITQSSVQRISNARCKKLPAAAIIKKNRNPNAYDPTALRLKAGEKLLVTAIHDNGMWEGELESTKVKGFFPFTHVDFIDSKLTKSETPFAELRRSTASTSST